MVTFYYDGSPANYNRGIMEWKRNLIVNIRHVCHRYDPEITYMILECKQELDGTYISNTDPKIHIVEIIFHQNDIRLNHPL